MLTLLTYIAGLILISLTLLALSFFISSIWEGEKRATFYAGILFVVTLGTGTAFFYLNSTGFFASPPGSLVLIIGLILALIVVALLILPIGKNPKALEGTKGLVVSDVNRVDERETVFSRLYNERMHSKGLAPDSPAPSGGESEPSAGLIMPSGTGDDPGASEAGGAVGIDGEAGLVNLQMAEASETITIRLSFPGTIQPKASSKKIEINPEEASIRVKGFAKSLGADLVGITELDQRWIYSHRGKVSGDNSGWGSEIDLDHRYAIVFAIEMDLALVDSSPHTPVIVETMIDYSLGAFISAQLSQFIANLGYDARGQQMSRYDAMLPPLAVDAGLGELSRMGYLISKEFGPRIRLGAVTTNLPLLPDKPVDSGVVDFCNKCKKCAHCCPTNSIPLDGRKEVNGSVRWIIETDTCHEYWRKLGTDCAICMKVCPWSHARTFPHRLITEAVTRNANSRTLFNWMDDLFYGKRPPTKSPPNWVQHG